MFSPIEVFGFLTGLIMSICFMLFLDGLKLGHVWKSEFFFYGWIGALIYFLTHLRFELLQDDSFFIGVTVGLAISILWLRYGVRYSDLWLSKLSLKSLLNTDKESDILDEISEEETIALTYEPWKYFKKNKFFLGIDSNKKPFYVSELPHSFYAGTSGSGKGNALQSLAAQSVLNDEAMIYFDPKNDKFGPHAIYEACQRFEKPYRFINVGSDQCAQINVVAGASEREIVQLLQSGLSLSNKNTDGDFHRGNDRKASRLVAEMIFSQKLTLTEAYLQIREDCFFTQKAAGFLEKLEALAGVAAINAKTDECYLADFVFKGGGIYVQSGMDEDVERIAQLLILIRVTQIASSRDRLGCSPKIVCIVADEVRFQMSRSLLSVLSAGRDKSIRAILAFQSMVDLRASESEMSPDVIEGIVLENTPIKHVYRLEDPRTAEWLAEKSGKTLVRQESFETRKNLLFTERLTCKTMREVRTPILDPNITLNLKKGWGALLMHGKVSRLLICSLICPLSNLAISIQSHVSSDEVLLDSSSFF